MFKKALIFSSIFFGVLHLQNAFGAIVFGVIACLLYLQTRSLLVPILVHITFNTIVSLKNLALKNFMDTFGSSGHNDTPVETMPSFIFGFAIILVIIGSLWIIPFVKKNWKIAIQQGLPSVE